MYWRFTDRARKVMQLANQEAQRFNHEYIGTEHILLGLIKEGQGVAALVLKNLGIDIRTVRLEVEKIVQPGPDMVTLGKLPQTPRAKKVIEYASEAARGLNHNYVGTEHLLLGLLREGHGVASLVLSNLGLKHERVREEILGILQNNPSSCLSKLPSEPFYLGRPLFPDRRRKSLLERVARAAGKTVRTILTGSGKRPAGSPTPSGLPPEGDRLAALEARTRALENQLTTARFLLGGILGTAAGALLGDRPGAAAGLLVGCGTVLLNSKIPALFAGAVAGGFVAANHFGDEIAAVVGAVIGALLSACVSEIGRPPRA
jgi:hypothetical protein